MKSQKHWPRLTQPELVRLGPAPLWRWRQCTYRPFPWAFHEKELPWDVPQSHLHPCPQALLINCGRSLTVESRECKGSLSSTTLPLQLGWDMSTCRFWYSWTPLFLLALLSSSLCPWRCAQESCEPLASLLLPCDPSKTSGCFSSLFRSTLATQQIVLPPHCKCPILAYVFVRSSTV